MDDRFGISIKNRSDCIIIEAKNGGQGKDCPSLDQTFQTEFNELLFISIAWKQNQNFVDSPMIRLRGSYTSTADLSEN